MICQEKSVLVLVTIEPAQVAIGQDMPVLHSRVLLAIEHQVPLKRARVVIVRGVQLHQCQVVLHGWTTDKTRGMTKPMECNTVKICFA